MHVWPTDREIISGIKTAGSIAEYARQLGIPRKTVSDKYARILNTIDTGDILMIADTQIHPNSRTEHLYALARYIARHRPACIVHIGDHWDFPSLSSYASGLESEGRRLYDDLEAGFDAFKIIMSEADRIANYNPEKHFLMGNHEDRLRRFVASNPVLEGCFDLDRFVEDQGWTVHGFKQPYWRDNICFTHYLENAMSGRAVGGSIENKLNKFPHSFAMGHQQQFQYARRQNLLGRPHIGVVAGAFYIDDEDYRGSNNTEVRGFVHFKNYTNRYGYSDYDIEYVSLERLMENYSG
jgi:hypothetical protein